MLWLLIGLSAFCLLLLLIGFVWMLLRSGQTTYRQGEDVGREMVAGRMEEDDETTILQHTAFKGKAKSRKTEASTSFGDLKGQIKSGRWSQALPVLLVISGLLGLVVFGSLALLVAMEDKLVGGLIALVAIFTSLRVLVSLIRA